MGDRPAAPARLRIYSPVNTANPVWDKGLCWYLKAVGDGWGVEERERY